MPPFYLRRSRQVNGLYLSVRGGGGGGNFCELTFDLKKVLLKPKYFIAFFDAGLLGHCYLLSAGHGGGAASDNLHSLDSKEAPLASGFIIHPARSLSSTQRRRGKLVEGRIRPLGSGIGICGSASPLLLAIQRTDLIISSQRSGLDKEQSYSSYSLGFVQPLERTARAARPWELICIQH